MNEELLKRLDLLFAKVGELGTDVFHAALRQVRADMVESFVIAGVSVLSMIGLGFLLRHAIKDGNDDTMVLSTILIFIGVLILAISGFIGYDRFVAPDFHAMEIILKSISK